MPSQPFPAQLSNPFALGHIVASSLVLGAITNTNGVAPVSIVLNAHGFTPGSRVRITGVTGQTTINGDWVIGVTDANTITVPIAGNGVASAAGSASRFAIPITANHPELAGFGYLTNSITFNAFASNTGNIYIGPASTMTRVSPFTDCVYILKPGSTQNMPFFSPGNSNIISIDTWGVDYDVVGEGVLVSVFTK